MGAVERIMSGEMTLFFGEVRALRDKMNGGSIKEEKKVDCFRRVLQGKETALP